MNELFERCPFFFGFTTRKNKEGPDCLNSSSTLFYILRTYVLFMIITEKSRNRERRWKGVGVMKDKELKVEDVKSPHSAPSSFKFHRQSFQVTDAKVMSSTGLEILRLSTRKWWCVFYFQQNKNVPLRQITEAKVRGKGLEEVWNDENGWLLKRDSGMKDQDERSREMEIPIFKTLSKIKPTEPLRSVK